MAITDQLEGGLAAPTDGGAVPISRRWDVALLSVLVLFLLPAGAAVQLLIGGDWDFWTDWKDDVYWPLFGSAVVILIPAALQYIAWKKLRLPAAGLVATAQLIATMLNRYLNFHIFVFFPFNFVWPALAIPAALLADVILMKTRSFLLTALFAGMLWGALFTISNWPMVAPFRQPVVYNGSVMTVADVQGFQYVRGATPEYLRGIKKGGLRSFAGQSNATTAIFAGTICVAVYGAGIAVAKLIALLPYRRFVKAL